MLTLTGGESATWFDKHDKLCKIEDPGLRKGKRFTFLKNRYQFSSLLNALRPRPHVSEYFLKTHLFLAVLGQRPHGDSAFDHRKRSFSITLSRV